MPNWLARSTLDHQDILLVRDTRTALCPLYSLTNDGVSRRGNRAGPGARAGLPGMYMIPLGTTASSTHEGHSSNKDEEQKST